LLQSAVYTVGVITGIFEG